MSTHVPIRTTYHTLRHTHAGGAGVPNLERLRGLLVGVVQTGVRGGDLPGVRALLPHARHVRPWWQGAGRTGYDTIR